MGYDESSCQVGSARPGSGQCSRTRGPVHWFWALAVSEHLFIQEWPQVRLPEMHCMQSRPISLLANCQRSRLRPCSGAQVKHCGRRTVIARALTLQAPVTLGNVTISSRPELLRAIKSIYTNVSSAGHRHSCAQISEWPHQRSSLTALCLCRSMRKVPLPPTTPLRALSSTVQVGKSLSVLDRCFYL